MVGQLRFRFRDACFDPRLLLDDCCWELSGSSTSSVGSSPLFSSAKN
jgi:hypothetical protein